MKIHKKIWIGIVFLSVVMAGIVLLGLPTKTLAALPSVTCNGKVLVGSTVCPSSSSSAFSGTVTTAQLDKANYNFDQKATGVIRAVINGQDISFKDSNVFGGGANYKPQSGPFCDGTQYGQDGLSDKLKGITLDESFDSIVKNGVNTVKGAVNFDYNDPNGSCQNYQNTLTFNKDSSGSFVAKEEPAAGGGDSSNDSSACVANSSTGLEWILCPVTTSISKAVDGINKLIESQLRFDVNGNLSNKDETHTAWSLIKNLVTSLVVIVMLIMVISQAIGGGPFDAYTIKKMLPKLVIAVIAMQVSWDLCKWAISLANDAGDGIKQIMLAPFGGGGNLDLNSILHRLEPTVWALGSQAIIPVLLTGTVILGAVLLPGTMVIAFGLFIGVFMALAVLLFRNVLIVALVLFAPLAFLIWVLPGQGTQRMWKLWSENFTKLLLMFPLIIAILYTGRIFAWIVADAGTPGLIDYITILVAYFGPYFIIFKAYKWGGSALAAAGNGLSKGRQKLVQSAAPIIKTVGERAQGNLADRYAIRSAGFRQARSKVEGIRNRMKALEASGKSAAHLQPELAAAEAEAAKIGKRDRLRRAGLKIAAGHPLPTERAQIETIAKAAAYKKDLVDKKQALIHTDFVEELNRNGGDVVGAKEYIRDKYGIGNYGKNADGSVKTDNLGNPTEVKDAYTERAMHNWLIDTRSAMELGDMEWRHGAIKDDTQQLDAKEFMAGGSYAHLNPTNDAKKAKELSNRSKIIGYKSNPTLTREEILEGKKPNFDIAKTTGFMGMMNADPQRFAYVAEKLPTLQPFNQELGGGPKRTDYRPAVVGTDGSIIRAADSKSSEVGATPISVADYLPGGVHGNLNTKTDPAEAQERAQELAVEEADRRAVLLADDARLLKWQSNMESPRQYATVRPEEYQIMDSIKTRLEEIGLKSQAAEKLHDTLEELAQSKGVEGISIVQQMMGGEKSARGAVNSMFGTGYLEGKLGVQLKNPTVQATEQGRIAELPRQDALTSEPSRRAFKQALLADASKEPRAQSGIARELIQTLGETAGYSQAAHGTDQAQYLQVLRELHDSSGASLGTVEAFNSIIDGIVGGLDNRVQRAVRTAVAQGKPPDEVRRIGEEARRVANEEIGEYQVMRLDVPGDDPTILDVPH